MARILLNKYGMTFWTRDATRNPGGEQGETEGILRHLLSQGHSVVYYGPHRGDLPCPAIRPNSKGLNPDSPQGEQLEHWKMFDLPQLEACGDFDMCIQVNGMPPTRCMIDNPAWTRCQQFAIARCAPVLMAIDHFKIPRICVNNDPRTYPHDHEWTDMMPSVRPRALLDQTSKTKIVRMNGKIYNRVSHYAKAESWGYLKPHQGEVKALRNLVTVISHAHVNDGIRKGVWDPWLHILREEDIVYGNGWERFSINIDWKGCAKAHLVPEIFGRTQFSPVVSHTEGFYTGKPYVMLNSNCCPLIYGRGEIGTWDREGHYLPLDSPLRLSRTTAVAHAMHLDYEDVLGQMKEIFKPDYSELDKCVEAFEKDSQNNDFGGYFPIDTN